MTAVARNVLIILAIAAAVAFLPGGGDTADAVGAALSVAILASFVMLAVRFYRENRMTIFGLGDTYRGMLYAALGGIVVALAGIDKLLDSAAGTVAWFALVVGAIVALVAVWRHHRSYGI